MDNKKVTVLVFQGPYNDATIDAIRALQYNSNVKTVVFTGPNNDATIDAIGVLQNNSNVKKVVFTGPYPDPEQIHAIFKLLKNNKYLKKVIFSRLPNEIQDTIKAIELPGNRPLLIFK